MNDGAKHIGYLIAYPHFVGVACQACVTAADPSQVGDPTPVKLFDVNVYPYKQTCHGCGETLVEPRSHLWPELFVKPASANGPRPWEQSAGDPDLFIDAVNGK